MRKLLIVVSGIVAAGVVGFVVWQGSQDPKPPPAQADRATQPQLACGQAPVAIANLTVAELKSLATRLRLGRDVEAAVAAISRHDEKVALYASQRVARSLINLSEVTKAKSCVGPACQQSEFVKSLLTQSNLQVHNISAKPSEAQMDHFVGVWRRAAVDDAEFLLGCPWAK